MKQGRFSEEQIIGILKQNEAGAQVTQLCRDHGIGESTFYKWNAPRGYPIRRFRSQRGQTAAGTGGRKQQAQEATR